MATIGIKKEIHKAIDSIDDDAFLQAVYTILWGKINEEPFELSPVHKAILDDREIKRQQNKSKSYSWAEAKKIIRSRSKTNA